jgi:hypothetical protein
MFLELPFARAASMRTRCFAAPAAPARPICIKQLLPGGHLHQADGQLL